jgi:hypothetical protein
MANSYVPYGLLASQPVKMLLRTVATQGAIFYFILFYFIYSLRTASYAPVKMLLPTFF